jgi:hypothetical protein
MRIRLDGEIELDQPRPDAGQNQGEQRQTDSRSFFQKLKFWKFAVNVLTLLFVGWYAHEATVANRLTREALIFNQRPVLSVLISAINADGDRLASNVLVSNLGNSPTAYWEMSHVVWSKTHLRDLHDSMPPPKQRRLIFPKQGDGFAVTPSNPMDPAFATKIQLGQGSGWAYVGVWIWYGRYHTFACQEFELPHLVMRPCITRDANDAD